MKQINIKKPKYIIPILILPFILGIGWLVKDMINSAPAEETTLVETEELNLDIPDANLEKREIKSKFESLKGAFNKSSDYSSIQTIDKEEEVSEIESSGSLYSNDEIRQIDSLNQASRIREKELEQQIKGFPTIDESSQTETRKAPEKSKMQEEMELFKMQMAYIDSLQNPRPRTPQKKQDEKPKEKAIEVVKAKNPAEVYFNTVGKCNGTTSTSFMSASTGRAVGKEQKTSLITAILDETLKVTDGSRVRIRLLDDIMINDALLTKGTYLYGNVSGFKAQRVHINISSIMVDGRQMKVDLSVYDNDGQEGFFVPSSAFRDLSKDVGAQIGSQTIQMNSQSEGVEQFALGALQDAYRSTTQALSKNIKKNKAKLKYNTQVFLVNNKDKEQ